MHPLVQMPFSVHLQWTTSLHLGDFCPDELTVQLRIRVCPIMLVHNACIRRYIQLQMPIYYSLEEKNVQVNLLTLYLHWDIRQLSLFRARQQTALIPPNMDNGMYDMN